MFLEATLSFKAAARLAPTQINNSTPTWKNSATFFACSFVMGRFPALRSLDSVIGCANGSLESSPGRICLELRSGAASYDRLRPFLNRLALLTPVFLGRVPRPGVLQPEWGESKRARVDPGGLDLAGQIWIAGIAPLSVRPNRNDFARRQVPEAFGAKRHALLAPRIPAPHGEPLDREHNQFDQSG